MSYRTGLHPSLDAELAEPEPIRQTDTRTITEMQRDEQARRNRIANLGFARAVASHYAWIQLSACKYAIIEQTSISASIRDEANPLGMKRFSFVEGCERMDYQPMMERYMQLITEEQETERMRRVTA